MGRVNVRGENTQFLQFKNYEKSPLCVCVCMHACESTDFESTYVNKGSTNEPFPPAEILCE